VGLILEYPLTYIQLKKPATAVPHLCVIYIFMQHFTMPPHSCRGHIFHCCSSMAVFKTCYCSHTKLHHHSRTHTFIVILLQIWITVKSREPCRSKPWVASKHRNSVLMSIPATVITRNFATKLQQLSVTRAPQWLCFIFWK